MIDDVIRQKRREVFLRSIPNTIFFILITLLFAYFYKIKNIWGETITIAVVFTLLRYFYNFTPVFMIPFLSIFLVIAIYLHTLNLSFIYDSLIYLLTDYKGIGLDGVYVRFLLIVSSCYLLFSQSEPHSVLFDKPKKLKFLKFYRNLNYYFEFPMAFVLLLIYYRSEPLNDSTGFIGEIIKYSIICLVLFVLNIIANYIVNKKLKVIDISYEDYTAYVKRKSKTKNKK